MPAPEADEPQYADGTVVPAALDSTTREYSRGENQHTGAKGAEPAELAPTMTSIAPATGPAAGGTVVVLTGTHLGGSTGATVGGVAATAFSVQSETQCTFTTPAGTVGAQAVAVANPAGAATGSVSFTYA